MELNPEKHRVFGIKAGFEELEKGQTVLHSLGSILKGANNEDPKSVPNIKTFGVTKSKYFCMLFTENSPLGMVHVLILLTNMVSQQGYEQG